MQRSHHSPCRIASPLRPERGGDSFTLTDLGEGSFLLTPQVSEVARLGDQVVQVMAEEGVDLEEMLRALDQERGIYYWEHYAGSCC